VDWQESIHPSIIYRLSGGRVAGAAALTEKPRQEWFSVMFWSFLQKRWSGLWLTFNLSILFWHLGECFNWAKHEDCKHFSSLFSLSLNCWDLAMINISSSTRNSISASAVCAFNLSSVTLAFNGPFRYQENPRTAWLSTPNPLPNFQVIHLWKQTERW